MGSVKSSFYNVVSDKWQQLPIVLRNFVISASILLAFWYIGYVCILMPNGRVDNWLTKVTAKATTYCLNSCYKTGFTTVPQRFFDDDRLGGLHTMQYIYYIKQPVMFIFRGCNALSLYVLYVGFLLCAPGAMLRKLVYSVIGIHSILILNIIRCAALAWLDLNKPQWMDFAHHYAFTTIVYTFIFLLWILFIRKTVEA